MKDDYLSSVGFECHTPEIHIIIPVPECDFDWYRYHEFLYNQARLSKPLNPIWVAIPFLFLLIAMILIG